MHLVKAPNLEGIARWIRHCNPQDYTAGLLPFRCANKTVGHVQPSFARQLARFPNVFMVTENKVEIHPELQSPETRTEAAAGVMQNLCNEGIVTGWRNETYPVVSSFYDTPCMLVERATAVPLGIRTYAVHLNGYVRTEKGVKLWVATRAKTKPTWPSKLDHLCAGGQPHGISPAENVVKECAEEASIPEHIARQARPAGAVSYAYPTEKGLERECIFVYDLQLPKDFQPKPADGEVEKFELIDIEKVAAIIKDTDDFKDNCNLVIIDFMLRHGIFQPESPGYLDLVSGLRQEDCM